MGLIKFLINTIFNLNTVSFLFILCFNSGLFYKFMCQVMVMDTVSVLFLLLPLLFPLLLGERQRHICREAGCRQLDQLFPTFSGGPFDEAQNGQRGGGGGRHCRRRQMTAGHRKQKKSKFGGAQKLILVEKSNKKIIWQFFFLKYAIKIWIKAFWEPNTVICSVLGTTDAYCLDVQSLSIGRYNVYTILCIYLYIY